MNREAIYSALWARLPQGQFAHASRRVRMYTDLANGEFPSLMMSQGTEVSQKVTRQPVKWTFSVELLIYVHTGGDLRNIPAVLLNPLIDAVTDSLRSDPAFAELTLGGLVERCSVEGEITTDGGSLDVHGFAIIPVTIVVSDN